MPAAKQQTPDEAFEQWWSLWPPRRKVSKAAAKKAYQNAVFALRDQHDWNRRQAEEYLAERLKVFAASPKAQGRYCPMPSTWLNQGRYDDDPAAWQEGDHDGQGGLFDGRVHE